MGRCVFRCFEYTLNRLQCNLLFTIEKVNKAGILQEISALLKGHLLLLIAQHQRQVDAIGFDCDDHCIWCRSGQSQAVGDGERKR